MNIKDNIRENIHIEKTIKWLQKDRTVYEYYLYDIFIAQIETMTVTSRFSKLHTNHIIGFSTINFQWNPQTLEEKEDLYNFMKVQEKYKQSKQLLETLLGESKIPQLWSMVFENTIADIRLKWDKQIELYAAPTSRWFYQKVCNRLQEKDLIQNFWLSYKWTFNIELNTRQFLES